MINQVIPSIVQLWHLIPDDLLLPQIAVHLGNTQATERKNFTCASYKLY